MNKAEETRTYLRSLNLFWCRDNLDQALQTASNTDISYLDFLNQLLQGEINYREKRSEEPRMKMAGFPFVKTIDEFDSAFQRSITRKQVNQLLDMQWIEKFYNLILLGPPGLAKHVCQLAWGLKPLAGVTG